MSKLFLSAAVFMVLVSCTPKTENQLQQEAGKQTAAQNKSDWHDDMQKIVENARFFEIGRTAYFDQTYEIFRYNEYMKEYRSGQSYAFGAPSVYYHHLTIDGPDYSIPFRQDSYGLPALPDPPHFVYDRFTIKEGMRGILGSEATDWIASSWAKPTQDSIEEADDEILKSIAESINFQRSINWGLYRIESAHFLFKHQNPKLTGRYLVVYTRTSQERLLYIGVKLIETEFEP